MDKLTGRAEEQVTIKKALEGDQDAYTVLYKANRDRVFNSLWTLCHSQDVAEDLTQDAFLRAFMHLKKFKGKSSFHTWIHRIALNEFFMMRRKRKLDIISFEDMDQKVVEKKLKIDDVRQKGLLDRMELHNALGSLPMSHRMIFMMHYVMEYQVKQIATALDLSVPAVKARTYRARLELRKVLIGDSYVV